MKSLLFIIFYSLISISKEIKVGLVLDKGGKDDKSFNTAAYEGLIKAQKELGIKTKYVEATDDNIFEPLIRSLAQKDFDLIIGIGFSQKEAIQKVASQFPKKNFAIVDAEVNLPNVKSLMFEEHLGSYLMGVAAVLSSKSLKIGFIGGMDIPLIRRFEMGYDAGIKNSNSKAKLVSNFVGITSEAWNNPSKAKELALSQYNSGVEVIFAAAGASNLGIFDAAEEKKKLAIGVDSNQNWIKPGFILTSMLKRVDVAVFETCKEVQVGQFKSGVSRFGLENKGIDYALDKNNEKLLTKEILRKLDDTKMLLISSKIKVPDYYLKNIKK